MKFKLIILILLTAALAFMLTACADIEHMYYSVKFDTGDSSAPMVKAVEEGDKIKKPEDPTKSGYVFIGWYNGDTLWDFDNGTVTSDMTLTAKFEKDTLKVTFKNDDSTTIVVVSSGGTISTPEAPQKANHDFLGWYNGTKQWNFDTDTVTEDITLTAIWSKIPSYTVIFNTNGGSPISAQTVYRDSKLTQPAITTKQGHHFEYWYLDSEDDIWNFTKDTVTSDIVLNAKWIPYATYTVTFDSNGGSSIAPQYITEGQIATVPATPTQEHSVFNGWYLYKNGILSDTVWDFSTPITDDITLMADWSAAPTHTVSFNLGILSNLIPSYSVENQYIINGEKANEPIAPSISAQLHEYRFDGWYIDDTKWNFATDTISSDITLTAKMTKIHKVEVIIGKDGYGNSLDPNVDRTYYIADGETLPIIPTPLYPIEENRDKYDFEGWYGYGNVLWDFNTPITSNTVIYGMWVPTLPEHIIG